jgi:hypothetical protein
VLWICYNDLNIDILPSKKELSSVFTYNASDGSLRRGSKIYKNQDKSGYLRLTYKNKQYYIHRIVWKIHHGYLPLSIHIDHINRDKSDNRIENLRIVTPKENAKNRDYSNGWSNNTSGKTGVHWNSLSKKWWARIKVDNKRINLGLYDNIEDAILARQEAEKIYFI